MDRNKIFKEKAYILLNKLKIKEQEEILDTSVVASSSSQRNNNFSTNMLYHEEMLKYIQFLENETYTTECSNNQKIDDTTKILNQINDKFLIESILEEIEVLQSTSTDINEGGSLEDQQICLIKSACDLIQILLKMKKTIKNEINKRCENCNN
jgi:hypothetical protein